LSKITMPVLNHQIKTAKPMAMELSVIAGMAMRLEMWRLWRWWNYQAGAMRTCSGSAWCCTG
jgi:hypothetical protein